MEVDAGFPSRRKGKIEDERNKETAAMLTSLFSTVVACGLAGLSSAKLLGSSFGVPSIDATYDYVVVGGGTAGLTIAARIAEANIGTVAVIEAGTFYEISNGNWSQVPATGGMFTSTGADDWQPMIDWGYQTTPQAGAYDRPIHYTRGKAFGGSSARNFMCYHRGTRGSYEKWVQATGDNNYTFDGFMPYFEKSIKFTDPNTELRFANATPEYDVSVMGKGDGLLSVSFPNYVQAFATWVTQGLSELGFNIIPGFQSGELMGQGYLMFTINATTMERDSSATSFLRHSLAYDNYFLYPWTMAKRIVFDGDKTARGVVLDTAGAQYTLTANKEVILSAGVFGSPQLLMVSGVGDAEALRPLDIPVVADLPGVGQGMQDHIYFGPSYRVNAPTISALGYPEFAAKAAEDYNTRAAGMYTNVGTDVLGWEKLPEPLRSQSLSNASRDALATFPEDWPELEYITLGSYLGWQNDSLNADPHDGYNYASLAAALVAPLSRGNITIRSSDTADPPLINPNFLSAPADVEIAVAGYKRVREFWATEAMRPFLVGEQPEAFPGPEVASDAEILDIIKRSYNTVYHGACTCAMGKPDDPMAVTDAQGRVYGVSGLRVVDASSFPSLPPGHPLATVYALAEKIADDVIAGN
ncbi:uncharacterized protein B0H64DRAFT_14039 [Chaetomium fimeti]|uniref:Glucose-methanol-choline oxidoreductase N-terminal domain-containing protein n=1 Tax=Chaetomium fimeti TaxID=1854472 RepID=A0AAE0HQ51_9PEZI|nr:hypothetical protein B0H64DRAFT_14039 [Chaetomium fimeti]